MAVLNGLSAAITGNRPFESTASTGGPIDRASLADSPATSGSGLSSVTTAQDLAARTATCLYASPFRCSTKGR